MVAVYCLSASICIAGGLENCLGDTAPPSATDDGDGRAEDDDSAAETWAPDWAPTGVDPDDGVDEAGGAGELQPTSVTSTIAAMPRTKRFNDWSHPRTRNGRTPS